MMVTRPRKWMLNSSLRDHFQSNPNHYLLTPFGPLRSFNGPSLAPTRLRSHLRADRERTLRLSRAGWRCRHPDADENLAPGLPGAEVPPPRQERVDVPPLELIITVRKPQSIV